MSGGSRWVTECPEYRGFWPETSWEYPFSLPHELSCKLLVFSGKQAHGEATTLHRGQLRQNCHGPTRVPPCAGILARAVSFWPGWLCQDNVGQNSVRYISFVFLHFFFLLKTEFPSMCCLLPTVNNGKTDVLMFDFCKLWRSEPPHYVHEMIPFPVAIHCPLVWC